MNKTKKKLKRQEEKELTAFIRNIFSKDGTYDEGGWIPAKKIGVRNKMRNRKLRSHIYNRWRVKDAIKDAVKNKDVVLRQEEKLIKSTNLLNTETKTIYYLYSFEGGHRVRLTKEEANYYNQLNTKAYE